MVNGRTSYSDFSREHGKDERYKAIEKSRERESQFNEFQIEVRRKEKEEKEEKRKQIKKDFKSLLKETEGIDRHAYWGDVKKLIQILVTKLWSRARRKKTGLWTMCTS